jgi:hypothetical protein
VVVRISVVPLCVSVMVFVWTDEMTWVRVTGLADTVRVAVFPSTVFVTVTAAPLLVGEAAEVFSPDPVVVEAEDEVEEPEPDCEEPNHGWFGGGEES